MPLTHETPFSAHLVTALADVDPSAWNACATGHAAAPASDSESQEEPANPFLSHEFLVALEVSGCVDGRSGWQSAHLIIEDEAGGIAAAAPCYLKSHSRGEYVFDAAWAEAYERAGGQYYPKLQIAVPFTPVTGPRLLVAPGPQRRHAEQALIQGLAALQRQFGVSSTHATFATHADATRLEQAGYLLRTDQQFHWLNEGYADFETFLAALSSRKRKVIHRERRDALAGGITIDWLTGRDITEAHWDAFFSFYMDTGSRKWGRPYLNRRFFSEVGARMADRIVLVMAKRAGRYIAGAINFVGRHTLYGRNWGCIEQHPFLHFEVCYYQAIDYAIAHGLSRVEAGAQGEHKLARGYRPITTYSAHAIADAGFRRAIANYLARERQYVEATHNELDAYLPFRKGVTAETE
jgi:predicted N-acyltransferase